MKRLVHKRLRAITKIASHDETRPFLTGVHVRARKDGGVMFETCDGSRLLRVVEKAPDQYNNPEDFPVIPGVPESDGRSVAIVPSESWEQALAAKAFPKRSSIPVLDNALLVLNKQHATFVATDLEKSSVVPSRLLDGSYPNTEATFPRTEPQLSVYVNAKLLAELLEVLATVVPSDLNYAVRMDFFGDLNPIQISADDRERYKAVALVMPVRMNDPIVPPVEAAEPETVE